MIALQCQNTCSSIYVFGLYKMCRECHSNNNQRTCTVHVECVYISCVVCTAAAVTNLFLFEILSAETVWTLIELFIEGIGNAVSSEDVGMPWVLAGLSPADW